MWCHPFHSPSSTLAQRVALLPVALVILPLLFSLPAAGQGFSVYEQGTCTMAQAGAAVASPCGDGSSIFFNPAGLLDTEGVTVSGGATAVMAQGSFTDDYTGTETELQNDPILVPHLYASWRSSPDLAFGLGVYVPYGLETVWPTDWDGAFEGYENGLQSVYVQPTIAYQITDRIRIGGGPILGHSQVTLNQRIDASAQAVPSPQVPEGTTFGNLGIPFHTAFADAGLEGDGFGFGGHIGVMVDVTDRIRFGSRFLSPITFVYEGEADFSQVPTGLQLPANNPLSSNAVSLDFVLEPAFVEGPLVDQSIETELTMPAQLVAGLAMDVTDRLVLQADYQWTGWSSFDTIPLDFERDALDQERNEGYENTSAFRVGGAYDLTEAVTLRGGYLFNQAAAPDRTVTPLLPEADRHHVTAGFGWQVLDQMTVNISYQYLGQNDRRGRVRGPRPGEENPSVEDLNSGLYTFHAHLIGTTLTISL